MNFLRVLPVLLAYLLLAAHFYRSGHWPLVLLSLLVPALLALRKPWVPGVIWAGLAVGALEWLRTLWSIAELRAQFGMPWQRMAIILGAVALFTLAAGLVFRTRALRARYQR